MSIQQEVVPNRRLLLIYSAPYFAYVFIASVIGHHLSQETNYFLRLLSVTLIILWAKKWFFSLRGPKSVQASILLGIPAGLLGVILWIVLLMPFVHSGSGQAWSNGAFTLRLIAAGLLVPLFEEILMRGFLLRLALQWDRARRDGKRDPLGVALDESSVNDVAPGEWSWLAVVISTLAFAAGHHPQQWLACMAFGLLMAWLWIIRKDLLSCIVAHAVTNISLAIYVLHTGKWYLW